jgi:hypothetical protein
MLYEIIQSLLPVVVGIIIGNLVVAKYSNEIILFLRRFEATVARYTYE